LSRFALHAAYPCSVPTLSVEMPSVRRCFDQQQIMIQVCNDALATGILEDAFVMLRLDSLLTFQDFLYTRNTSGCKRLSFLKFRICSLVNASQLKLELSELQCCIRSKPVPPADWLLQIPVYLMKRSIRIRHQIVVVYRPTREVISQYPVIVKMTVCILRLRILPTRLQNVFFRCACSVMNYLF
jgi:hypothetical protein